MPEESVESQFEAGKAKPMNTYEEFWLRSNRDNLALALNAVFEGYVSHLPASDPDWKLYADGVIARLCGHPWDEHKARGFDA